MFKFKDASGKEWEWPKITGRVLSQLRDECKLDLRELLRKNTEAIGLSLSDDELVRNAVAKLSKLDEAGAAALEDAWDSETHQAAKEALVEYFFTLSQSVTKAKAVVAKMREADL